MRPVERVVTEYVEAELSARLKRRATGWTAPSEIARKVLADDRMVWSLGQLPREDPCQLRAEIEDRVRSLVHHHMHASRDRYGVRLWETYRVPGQRESRWYPTRGMTVNQVLLSGQAKMIQGRHLTVEGHLLVRMAEVAQGMGLALDDHFGGQYDVIAKEATRQIAGEDAA